MRELLSNKDQRHLEFLELLMSGGSFTLDTICTSIQQSVRTLSVDIKQINSFIQPACICTDVNGVYLRLTASGSNREIYNKLLRQSREYQLLVYLFFNNKKTIEDIADEQFIGISTLQRMIRKMNSVLSKRDIRIKRVNSFVQLLGNERQIGLLYIGIFNEWYLDEYGPLTVDEYTVLNQINLKAAEKMNLTVNYPDLKRVTLWAFVRLVRIKNGFASPNSAEGKLRILEEILENQELCNDFFAVFSIPLSEDLLYTIYYFVLKVEFAKNLDEIKIIVAKSKLAEHIDRRIKGLICLMAEVFSISTENTETVYLSIFNTLQLANEPPFILYSRGSVFMRLFRRTNPYIGAQVINVVEKVFGDVTNINALNEMAYLVITHWPEFVQKIQKKAPAVHIGYFFDSDIEHAQMISNIIKRISIVKVKDIIIMATCSNELYKSCKQIDVLITNIPGMLIPDTEVICIQEYPSPGDFSNIIDTIEKIKYKLWSKGKDMNQGSSIIW